MLHVITTSALTMMRRGEIWKSRAVTMDSIHDKNYGVLIAAGQALYHYSM